MKRAAVRHESLPEPMLKPLLGKHRLGQRPRAGDASLDLAGGRARAAVSQRFRSLRRWHEHVLARDARGAYFDPYLVYQDGGYTRVVPATSPRIEVTVDPELDAALDDRFDFSVSADLHAARR